MAKKPKLEKSVKLTAPVHHKLKAESLRTGASICSLLSDFIEDGIKRNAVARATARHADAAMKTYAEARRGQAQEGI